ncbi:MAG: zinc ABC transporter substrate-binding protein [bacterium]|nr:zinc ABC transporter substrate-binding protein [bacterium]
MSGRATIAMTLLLLCAAAASVAGPADADARPLVLVSIPPQAWLVERLAGDRIAVLELVPPGASPHAYDPTPRQLTAAAGAALWFTVGATMEQALQPRLQRMLPDLRIVPTADEAVGLPTSAAAHDDGHDHDGEHEHDPHVWLDPDQAAGAAARMATALGRLDPAGAAHYAERLVVLQRELADLDRELAATLAPVRGGELLVMHPAFGWFAERYGLTQTAVEQGGLSPSPRHLAAILERARARGVRTLFLQPQTSPDQARTVAREAGITVDVLDPLARDYAANLRGMAAAMLAAMSPAAAP